MEPPHISSSSPLLSPCPIRGVHRHGYSLGLLTVFLFSLALRFWSLDRFNQLAFDEIYYVRYGLDYLEGRSLFDAHPPLGKYLIAAGTWLGDRILFSNLSADQHLLNNAAGQLLSPYSYRWLNALVGATIPLLLAGVARQLTGQRLVGLLAAGLIALDGLFLVESRFALLHVYLVAFGLLGNLLWLRALRAPVGKRWRWLLASGLALGACISVKWNGLGYWLGPVVLNLSCNLIRLRQLDFLHESKSAPIPQPLTPNSGGRGASKSLSQTWERDLGRGPETHTSGLLTSHQRKRETRKPLEWRLFAQVSVLQVLLFLVVVPGLVYTGLWFPHLQLNPEVGLIQLHQQLLGFHQGSSVIGADTHDYCSPWWSWPLMIRPIAYALSRGGEPSVFFAVYALGNPLLWWGSAIAVVALAIASLRQVLSQPAKRYAQPLRRLFGLEASGRIGRSRRPSALPLGASLYLLFSFGANWLPWAAVERCTFVYHYLGALCFGAIALAWGLSWAWRQRGDWRWASTGFLGLVAIAFCFWLPIWLGLPLSEPAFRARLILPSWP